MKSIITTIAFLITAFLLVGFMSVDACMDAGGIWSKYGFVCEGTNEDFVPQYMRLAPFFWLFVLMVSVGAAFVTFKVTCKLQALTRRSSRVHAKRAAP